MSARAAAVDRTRARIIDAAVAVHARGGIAASSWEDIAREAGVAPATVYRHFPSLDDLVPACARAVFQGARLPTLRKAAEEFAGLDTPRQRLAKLVRESCRCYEQAEEWLDVAYREAHIVPALRAEIEVLRRSLETLVRAALLGTLAGPREHRVVSALIDFPFWRSLLDRGLPRKAACAALGDLTTGYLWPGDAPSARG